jgi:ABC-2 type transport system ATP-binding protein
LAAIETHALTRRYGDLVAVDHLDLTVASGEILAFLGPNGAGKTTTIRMLTGLIRPTEGTATIDGLDITRNPLEVKARVGVVPQRSNLYAELSARDNLIFVAGLYGVPRRRRRARADALLEQFHLTERADAPFGALSGGMKRRLTIAAALVHEPSIVFLDEPTTGLDVQSARSLRETILDLHRQGVTLFLTTHQVAEAERLADRVAILVKGRLVTVDTPAALRAECCGEASSRSPSTPLSGAAGGPGRARHGDAPRRSRRHVASRGHRGRRRPPRGAGHRPGDCGARSPGYPHRHPDPGGCFRAAHPPRRGSHG